MQYEREIPSRPRLTDIFQDEVKIYKLYEWQIYVIVQNASMVNRDQSLDLDKPKQWKRFGFGQRFIYTEDVYACCVRAFLFFIQTNNTIYDYI